jgi:hypothetical protein
MVIDSGPITINTYVRAFYDLTRETAMVSQHLTDFVQVVVARHPFLSAVLIILVVWFSYRWSVRVQRLPYPPGPKPSLLVGNIKDFPATEAWLTFAQWKDVYGTGACSSLRVSINVIKYLFRRRNPPRALGSALHHFELA